MSQTNNDNPTNDKPESAAPASDPADQFGGVDSQHERWLKYGVNVAVVSIIAIALAVLVTYAAERKPMRIDTTATGLYSLKPQTVKIIGNLKSPIRLVSLYTHSKPPETPDDTDENKTSQVAPEEAAQTVNDLLNEYASKGHNITSEAIDPVTSPSKVDDLIVEVENKYGGEVKKYQDFVNGFKGTIDQVSKIAEPEEKYIQNLSLPENVSPDVEMTLRQAMATVQGFPKALGTLQEALQKPLKQRPPDYKGAADAIHDGLDQLSMLLDAVIQNFGVLKSTKDVPPDLAKYMNDSLPHYQQMKKLVDDSIAQSKGLGELKLDTLRTALKERNTILVMGDKEWRVVRYDQVWKPAGDTGNGVTAKPRFAGEQQVTAAILGVNSSGTKQKIAFVRNGGAPLTMALPFSGGPPPLEDLAARLTLYNFDVVERDFSGAFAQRFRGMVPPEPSDEDLKSAIWIVWDLDRGQPNPETGEPGASLAPRLAQHLRDGGSAVVLANPRGDPLTDALGTWGVDIHADDMIVHEKIPDPSGGDDNDQVQRVLHWAFAFELHDFGDHALVAPLRGLDGIFLEMTPVTTHDINGYHATPLLPMPQNPPSWGTSNIDLPGGDPSKYAPKFDPKSDMASPIYGGAAVEKDGGGRLVVLGGVGPFTDGIVEITAKRLDPNAADVLRFPANGEIFTNSVFWAAHQDTLIDISPASMDIGRIGYMTPGKLNFWRVGVLLIGLPVCVLVLGACVYMKRRD